MKSLQTKQLPLEFEVYRRAKEISIRRVVAAVSGGRDSIAMLQVLSSIQKRLGFLLSVVHVHHGDSKSVSQTKFRDRAARTVARRAKMLGIPFSLIRVQPQGDNEEQLRDARLAALVDHAKQNEADFIALGHHAEDLFETRLIRLIRGTGPLGFQSMRMVSREAYGLAKLWRPLLETSRSDIQAYLASASLVRSRDWLEDPSNRDARYLRNSIRKYLVPAIEAVRTGGASAMARSFDLIAESLETLEAERPMSVPGPAMDRKELLSLSSGQRRNRFASWLRSNGIRGISRSQIDEIMKRIDTPRKNLTFKLGGRVWSVGLDIQCHVETPDETKI